MKKYTKEELYKMDATDVYKMVLKGDIITKFPAGFWKQPEAKQNAGQCTKYLIEELLKLNDKELKKQLSQNLFIQNKLQGMLCRCFNSSPYEAINNAYPDKFKVWEFKQVPQGYWKENENRIKATRWLIEEKLKFSDDELKEKLSAKLFIDNGLRGMLGTCFKDSPYEAINNAYPNKFKEWEFKSVPKRYWDKKENRIKAIKWLIEENLKLSDEELIERLSVKLFEEHGLGSMLTEHFYHSPYEAINTVYPDRFKEWEFKQVPKGHWNDKENRIKAIKWLIEEKLKLNNENLKEKLSMKLFEENGLGGLISTYFKGSIYNAINTVYPNKFKPWELKMVPNKFWNDKENGIKATKWLIEEKLKLNDEDLKQQLSQKLFVDNGLGGMLSLCFNNSPYQAINTTYPNKYKKCDFKGYRIEP